MMTRQTVCIVDLYNKVPKMVAIILYKNCHCSEEDL